MAIHPPIEARPGDPEPERVRSSGGVRFEDLWEHREFVRDLSLSIVGDLATAEDIAQDTLLKAFTLRDRIDGAQPLRNWLSVVARRRSFDELRRRKRQAAPTDELPHLTTTEPGPEESLLLGERVDTVLAAFTALKPREQRLLRTRAVEELPLRELARAEATSMASVRSVLSRARTKLTDSVERMGGYVVAPVMAISRRLRRAVERANVRLQSMGQAVAGGCERLAEAAVASAVATAAIAAALGLPVFRASASPHFDPATPAPGMQQVAVSKPVRGDNTPATSGSPDVATHDTVEVAAMSRGVSSPPNTTPPPPNSATPLPETPRPGVPDDMPVNNPLAPDPETVRQPEDAHIVQIATAPPHGEPSNHVFASGETNLWPCTSPCRVLFHSPDGGSTWERREAWGWDGGYLAMSSNFDADTTLLASGVGGLKVSYDFGHSFVPVPGGQLVNGPMTVSPRFATNDRRVLIGQFPASWQFDAGLGVVTPFAGAPPSVMSGFEFAFDPRPGSAGRYFALGYLASGGRVQETAETFSDAWVTGNNWVQAGSPAELPVVYECTELACNSGRPIDEFEQYGPMLAVPRGDSESAIFVGGQSEESGGGIWRSVDGGATFEKIQGLPDGDVLGMTTHGQTLYLAFSHYSYSPEQGTVQYGGVLKSTDLGNSWTMHGQGTRLADLGAWKITAVSDPHVLATAYSPYERGLWCSSDGGSTWSRRCS